jgi:Domain of unknown function (DUF4258)
VRTLNYVVTHHANEEIEDDCLSILDVENIILTGEIIERQRDRESKEIKCIVEGCTLEGDAAHTVIKIGATGRLIIITVYVV